MKHRDSLSDEEKKDYSSFKVKGVTVTIPTTQRKSLRELRESKNTLFVRNNTFKRITCNTDKVRFELGPKGSEQSIAYLPSDCLTQTGFLRLWGKEAITISDDEDMENEISLLSGGAIAYKPKVFTETSSIADGVVSKEVEPVHEPAPHNSDLTFQATGDPTKRNGYQIQSTNDCLISGCNEGVFIQQHFLDQGEPPLCQIHQDRKGEVASTPQPDGGFYHQVASIQPVQKSDLPAAE